MNTTIHKFTLFFTTCLLACSIGHAYEQDNWYLHGPIDSNLSGVFHQEYNATSKRDMLYKTATGVGLEVRDINGTLIETINTGGVTFEDIEFDLNTSSPASSRMHLVDGQNNGDQPSLSAVWLRHQVVNYSVLMIRIKFMYSNRMVR